jgi:hypothetical protein
MVKRGEKINDDNNLNTEGVVNANSSIFLPSDNCRLLLLGG